MLQNYQRPREGQPSTERVAPADLREKQLKPKGLTPTELGELHEGFRSRRRRRGIPERSRGRVGEHPRKRHRQVDRGAGDGSRGWHERTPRKADAERAAWI